MLIPVLQFIAVSATSLFTGAMLYINVVEHPARLGLDTASAFNQWAPGYARATWLQGPLAVLGLFGVIMRTNHTLLAPDREPSSAQTRELLMHWGRLHAVRTALSVASTIVFLWLMIGN